MKKSEKYKMMFQTGIIHLMERHHLQGWASLMDWPDYSPLCKGLFYRMIVRMTLRLRSSPQIIALGSGMQMVEYQTKILGLEWNRAVFIISYWRRI